MIRRRDCGALLAGAAIVLGGCSLMPGPRRQARQARRLADSLTQIEAASGGRLGVSILDLHSGRRYGHREGERFPMCSTFKLLAAGCVLARVDSGKEQLERRIRFQPGELVEYSPVTTSKAGTRAGMSVAELCEAAVTVSDNTAANLLLDSFGGPSGLTAYVRSLGDRMTRLDRCEPELNEAARGDPRDSTTPAAMLATMRSLVVGNALSPTSRSQLTAWLVGNKTGAHRLRAGLPAGWRVGEKTGSGRFGTTNDVGLFWPPGRSPILVTAYLTQSAFSPAVRDGALAEVARLAASVART